MAALIPQEYGGFGLGLTEASVIIEEINRSGGNSGACHGQMYNMGTYDTASVAKVTGGAMVREGAKSWYFLTADLAFGHSLEKVSSA